METQQQYEEMRKAFRENIAAIRNLLDQADNLNQIATAVEDTNAKQRLTDSIKDLYKTIDNLIKHTDYLFDQLIKYTSTLEYSRHS